MNRAVQALALAALLAAPSARADAPATASPIERYAEAMARGDWAAAWELLSDADRNAFDRDTFAARYEELARIPWLAPVLRSARSEGGTLTAIDWTHTRFARAALLADAAWSNRLPRRRYLEGATAQGGRLHLGLSADAPRPWNGAVVVTGQSSDWFALYARLYVRCPRPARYLLVELSSDSQRTSTAFDCAARGGKDEVVVPLDIDPREFRALSFSARVVGVVPRSPGPDPFRAPDPLVFGHESYPVLP